VVALETIIARKPSRSDDRSQRTAFRHPDASEKYGCISSLHLDAQAAAVDLSAAINDLCKRYSSILRHCRASGDGLERSRRARGRSACDDRRATVKPSGAVEPEGRRAQREMMMAAPSRETALRRAVRHVAYPFGDRDSFRPPMCEAEEAACQRRHAIPGIVEPAGDQSARAAAHRLGRTAKSCASCACCCRHSLRASGRRRTQSVLNVRARHPVTIGSRQDPAESRDDIEIACSSLSSRAPANSSNIALCCWSRLALLACGMSSAQFRCSRPAGCRRSSMSSRGLAGLAGDADRELDGAPGRSELIGVRRRPDRREGCARQQHAHDAQRPSPSVQRCAAARADWCGPAGSTIRGWP